jgi:hypothetical protein
MNCGRVNRARRKAETERNVTCRIEKLNRLLRAALSNTDLRRSLGENAETSFFLMLKLPMMVPTGICRAMQSLQARRAERSERHDDESAHYSSVCPTSYKNVAHLYSLRLDSCERKSPYLTQ